jgi:pyroglutamyl-peptidase
MSTAAAVTVTGFGPFPGVETNSSELAVRGLVARPGLRTAVLPTVYRETADQLRRLLATPPDVLLLTGIAKEAPGLRWEQLARNADTAVAPDARGDVRNGPIDASGPPTYPSTLPTSDLLAALADADIPAETSDDAGGYVCNHLFYVARHEVAIRGLATLCGFLHLPAIDAEWTVRRLTDALEICIDTLYVFIGTLSPPT